MSRPTRISQPKLDELLREHRKLRQKELQDKHTLAQRRIILSKMKKARKAALKEQAEANKEILEKLSHDQSTKT